MISLELIALLRLFLRFVLLYYHLIINLLLFSISLSLSLSLSLFLFLSLSFFLFHSIAHAQSGMAWLLTSRLQVNVASLYSASQLLVWFNLILDLVLDIIVVHVIDIFYFNPESYFRMISLELIALLRLFLRLVLLYYHLIINLLLFSISLSLSRSLSLSFSLCVSVCSSLSLSTSLSSSLLLYLSTSMTPPRSLSRSPFPFINLSKVTPLSHFLIPSLSLIFQLSFFFLIPCLR